VVDMAALVKIILLGAKGVGKTTLTPWERFQTDYSAVVGTNIALFTTMLPGSGTKVRLQIWELNTAERFASIRSTLLKGAMGIILVWDATDRQSFDEAKDWWLRVKEFVGDVTVLCVANKTDMTKKRVVTTEEGLQYCSENGFDYVESGLSRRSDFEHTLIEMAVKVTL
jgi:GTPase SAR1 family protein